MEECQIWCRSRTFSQSSWWEKDTTPMETLDLADPKRHQCIQVPSWANQSHCNTFIFLSTIHFWRSDIQNTYLASLGFISSHVALATIYIILIELPNDGFYCYGKTLQPKETWKRKLISSDTPASRPIIKESQSRSTRQELGGRNRNRSHRGVILSGLFLMALSACFLWTIHDHLPRCNCTNSEWAGPFHINHVSRIYTGWPTDWSYGDICSNEVPSSKSTPA